MEATQQKPVVDKIQGQARSNIETALAEVAQLEAALMDAYMEAGNIRFQYCRGLAQDLPEAAQTIQGASDRAEALCKRIEAIKAKL